MHSVTLPQAVKKSWPTAKAQNAQNACDHGQGGPDLQTEVMKWPTPAVMDVTGGDYPTEIKDGAIRSLHNAKGREQYYGARLRDAVKLFWPTASTRDWKDTPGMSMERDGQELGRVDQLARAVYFHQRGRLAPASRSTDGSRPESWATPRSGKTTGESAETWEKRKKKGDVSTMPLGAQVNAWKTPRACEGDKPPMVDKHHQGLTAQARPEAGAAGGRRGRRQAQPQMGRDPDGAADGLDVPGLPALGDKELAELYDWMARTTNRTDELRMCGNGVVPAAAAVAWRTLYRELCGE